MAFIEVYVITPDGRYRVEIDEDADADTLLNDLITELNLLVIEKGKKIEYTIKLVGTLKIHRGATIEIERTKPDSTVRRVIKD